MHAEIDPEKWVYTSMDFEQLRWHDSPVYAVELRPTYLGPPDVHGRSHEYLPGFVALDLDYLYDFAGKQYYVAPATLILTASEFEVNWKVPGPKQVLTTEIFSIIRHPSKLKPAMKGTMFLDYTLTFSTDHGSLVARAGELSLYLRAKPMLSPRPALDLMDRGGLSFARGRELTK